MGGPNNIRERPEFQALSKIEWMPDPQPWSSFSRKPEPSTEAASEGNLNHRPGSSIRGRPELPSQKKPQRKGQTSGTEQHQKEM